MTSFIHQLASLTAHRGPTCLLSPLLLSSSPLRALNAMDASRPPKRRRGRENLLHTSNADAVLVSSSATSSTFEAGSRRRVLKSTEQVPLPPVAAPLDAMPYAASENTSAAPVSVAGPGRVRQVIGGVEFLSSVPRQEDGEDVADEVSQKSMLRCNQLTVQLGGDHDFLGLIDTYMDELARLDGRGRHTSDACPGKTCSGAGRALYRCCDCHGGRLLCRECTVDVHVFLPLHRIQACELTPSSPAEL
jgi:hypothetical protein